MKIYYLCAPDSDPHRELSLPDATYQAHIVRVRGDADWYASRERALEHARGAGARHALVVVGHTRTVRVRRTSSRDGSRLATPEASPGDPYHDHALLLYLRRLLEGHAAAVLVPPWGAARNLPAPFQMYCPVIPMVAAYSVGIALACEPGAAALEWNIVCAGYRTITLTDTAYEQFGPTVLDTYGSATKWKRAHEKAIEAINEKYAHLRPRNKRKR